MSKEAYPGYYCNLRMYIARGRGREGIFSTAGYPFMRISMDQLVEAAATIKVREQNVEMLPIRAADGRLIAEVT